MVYLVESYRSRASTRRASSIRRVLAGVEARAVRVRGRLVVPGDEMELWLVEAASIVEVGIALAAVGVARSRISEVTELALFGPFEPEPALSQQVLAEPGGAT